MNDILLISPSITFIKELGIAYNWLNGEYVTLQDKSHPFYILLVKKEQNFKLSAFDNHTEDLNWLIENRFIIHSFNEIQEIYKENIKELNSGSKLHMVLLPAGTKCNFACRYCYQRHDGKAMDNFEKNSIVNFLKNSHLAEMQIDFFGGEPLLNYEWICDFSKDIRKHTEKNGIKYKASITTNGYLLKKGIFETLITECGITTFQITLDGLADTHDSMRVLTNNNATFDKIFENICATAESRYNFSLIVRINFNENFNIDNFIEYIKLSRIYGDDRFFFLFRPIASGWNCSTNDVHCKTGHEELKKIFYQKATRNGLQSAELILYGEFGNMSCPSGRENYLIVSPDLTIKKCTVALDNNINTIGRINNGQFEKNQNWELWIDKNMYPKYECVSCEVYSLCTGNSCPLFKIQNNEIKCISEKYKAQEVVAQIVEFLT